MLVDRTRITKLSELADLERRLTGAERQQHEEDVAHLIKAAYDDASEAARAAFMARVQPMPVAAWPWSAVQVSAAHSRGGAAAAGVAGRAITGLSPTPTAVAPPLLVLILGEAESADVDPGNRLPDRGTPEAAAWEPLYRALDRWDTAAIVKWIGPQGWVRPGGAVTDPTSDPSADATGRAPDQTSLAPSFSWRSPVVIAAGATIASTLGVVLFSLRRRGAGVAAQQGTP
jgi:hypothetical protein